ncbi:MAG: protein of unknown function DUF755 [Anelloviridae sp.]|nr:MAG: protein of unknown function DUF755 [Anelloviridae sp.]
MKGDNKSLKKLQNELQTTKQLKHLFYQLQTQAAYAQHTKRQKKHKRQHPRKKKKHQSRHDSSTSEESNANSDTGSTTSSTD